MKKILTRKNSLFSNFQTRNFIDFKKYKNVVGRILKGEDFNSEKTQKNEKEIDPSFKKENQQQNIKPSGRENLDQERDRQNLERDNIRKDDISNNNTKNK